MAESSIPVDLYNPGQVFACLGLLELADQLIGDAQGAFDWSDEANVSFKLKASTDVNPVAAVLKELAEATIVEIEPVGWPGESSITAESSEVFPSPIAHHKDNEGDYKRTKLPIALQFAPPSSGSLEIQHWSDDSSRPEFKLYAGNRSGFSIAGDMMRGKWGKPTKKGISKLSNQGLTQLWNADPAGLAQAPFHVLVPMAGSFNMDARGAWSPIDAGYSPDKQGHALVASSVVEILAVVGLEHYRPIEQERNVFMQCVWSDWLHPELARVALQGRLGCFQHRTFEFALRYSGKNKIVSFSQELTQ